VPRCLPRRFGDFHLRGERVIRPDRPTVTMDMKVRFNAVKARNLLVGAGAYYLSLWVSVPLAFGFGKVTHWIHYYGDFEGGVVMPIVVALPYALVAVFVGASLVWIVESERPLWMDASTDTSIRGKWIISPCSLGAAAYAFGASGRYDPCAASRCCVCTWWNSCGEVACGFARFPSNVWIGELQESGTTVARLPRLDVAATREIGVNP